MTETLEQQEVDQALITKDVSNDGDHDKFAHYVDTKKMWASKPDDPLVALCGHNLPKNRVPVEGRTICPDCQALYDAAPDE